MLLIKHYFSVQNVRQPYNRKIAYMKYCLHIYSYYDKIKQLNLNNIGRKFMSFVFKNLTNETRQYMKEEVEYDLKNGTLYISERLSSAGKDVYPSLLLKSIESGNEDTLASSLIGKFNPTYQRRNPKGGFTMAKIPSNQHQMLADGEFNRFYIRALCRIALLSGAQLRIYRAKISGAPRIESENKIGMYIQAEQLLSDLRTNAGTDTALGLPPGPNSGLSVELS